MLDESKVSSDESEKGNNTKFPPLPKPQVGKLRRETCVGVLSILTLTCVLSAPVLYCIKETTRIPEWTRIFFTSLIGFEVLGIFSSVLGLLLVKPDVLEHSRATHFQPPVDEPSSTVTTWISTGNTSSNITGSSADHRKNVTKGNHVYCVRCRLWRPENAVVHHCRKCQRCVVDFDHHCDVLGRCVGGVRPGGVDGYGQKRRYGSGNCMFLQALKCLLMWLVFSAIFFGITMSL